MSDDREVRQEMIGVVVENQKANGKQPNVRAAEDFLNRCAEIGRSAPPKAPVNTNRNDRLQEHVTRNLPEGQTRATVLRGEEAARVRRQVAMPIGRQPRLLSLSEQALASPEKAALFALRLRKLVSTYRDRVTGQKVYKYPDWEAKLRNAYNEGARTAWREEFGSFKEMRNIKIMEVVNASNEIFGRWDNPPGKKLVFSG